MKLSEFAAAYCARHKIEPTILNLDLIDEEHKRFENMFERGRVISLGHYLKRKRVVKADLKFETAENFKSKVSEEIENDVLAYYVDMGTEPYYIEIKTGEFEIYNPDSMQYENFYRLDDAIKILEIAINYEG